MTQTALPASHLKLTELNVLMAHRQLFTPDPRTETQGIYAVWMSYKNTTARS